MARKYRIVAEGSPHHVIQRGNRRQQVFFRSQDKTTYLDLLKKYCKKYEVLIWAYCLMDNHVHLILVPHTRNGLAKAVGQTHWHYTNLINGREDWRGYLWQGRFKSFVLNDYYLQAIVKYVELNPVRAGIVKNAESYKWSSAASHINNVEDPYLDRIPLLDQINDWRSYLRSENEMRELNKFRKHSSTGRPLGEKDFLESLSRKLNKNLLPRKRGPKPKIKCVSP